MKESFLYLGLAALGCAIYHLGQKSLPAQLNPMLLMAAVYFAAMVLALGASPFFARESAGGWKALLDGRLLVVSLGVLLIEGGFLLAYRSGASLQWSGIAVNGAAALILIPVAVFAFRESFSLSRAFGILLTLTGMALMGRK